MGCKSVSTCLPTALLSIGIAFIKQNSVRAVREGRGDRFRSAQQVGELDPVGYGHNYNQLHPTQPPDAE